jgi:iron complex transport system substrate-binding protein
MVFVTGVLRRTPLLVLGCFILAACNRPAADPPAAPSALPTRIVTLSPHLAELVFAVGAGGLLVGVSAHTDYPPAAAALPVVGDAFNLDQEQLTLLEPDLLLAWDTGTPAHVVDELRRRGYRVEVVTTTGLGDIPEALRHIGRLTGTEAAAAASVLVFETGLEALAQQYRDAGAISVFYQVDARPLYTINGDHFLSGLIEICGGLNIFADLDGLAPLISVEAVLERDPEIMLASSDAGPAAFAAWDRWTEVAANRYGNRFLMPADEIGRPTPRLLKGAAAVCEALATGRENRENRLRD